MDALIQMVLALGSKYPVLLTIFAVMGVLRAVFKPLFLFLDAVVIATPGPGDNEILAKVKASKPYQLVATALDYIASVKLPGYDR